MSVSSSAEGLERGRLPGGGEPRAPQVAGLRFRLRPLAGTQLRAGSGARAAARPGRGMAGAGHAAGAC